MSHAELTESQATRLHERLDLQVPNILRSDLPEEGKLQAIGLIVTGTLASLHELDEGSSPDSASRDLPLVEIDMEHSNVRGYDDETLDILAKRDAELRARGTDDVTRKAMLSDLEMALLCCRPPTVDAACASVQPSVLPPHDDTTITRMALHDRRLKAMQYTDAQRRFFLEQLEAYELLTQASDRT